MEVRYFVKERIGPRLDEIYVTDQPTEGFIDYGHADAWAFEQFSPYPSSNYFITEERV